MVSLQHHMVYFGSDIDFALWMLFWRRNVTILAVTGMTREAEIAGGNGVVAVAGGGDAAGLAAKLDALHGDITGVISIGLAGALLPHLQVGDVVIADRMLLGSERWLCDSGWRVALAAKLPFAHQGPLAGSNVILDTADAKAALFHTSGALAVDMESQVAAKFAAARGLKLAGLRVISDDAMHVLPPAALVAMRPDGGISLRAVLWSVAQNPLQIPALIRTGRASGKAFAQLLRCRDLCGANLCGI
jgi:hopanoid-associated phosphorylase